MDQSFNASCEKQVIIFRLERYLQSDFEYNSESFGRQRCCYCNLRRKYLLFKHIPKFRCNLPGKKFFFYILGLLFLS